MPNNHGPLSYGIFRRVDSLQLHAPFDQKEKELADKRSKCHDTGRHEEKLATRLRQFLNVLVGVSVGLAAVAVRYGCQQLGSWRQKALLSLLAGKEEWDHRFGEVWSKLTSTDGSKIQTAIEMHHASPINLASTQHKQLKHHGLFEKYELLLTELHTCPCNRS